MLALPQPRERAACQRGSAWSHLTVQLGRAWGCPCWGAAGSQWAGVPLGAGGEGAGWPASARRWQQDRPWLGWAGLGWALKGASQNHCGMEAMPCALHPVGTCVYTTNSGQA